MLEEAMAQAVVTDEQIILGAEVTREEKDLASLSRRSMKLKKALMVPWVSMDLCVAAKTEFEVNGI
ncbi:MAG: hypothetical protein ABSH17_13920 [Syntrophobacteraceae bacterium]